MHKLEKIREQRGEGQLEFAKWLGISYNTYKKILAGYNTALTKKHIQQISVINFVNIHKRTGLYLEDLLPNHPILKLIKK